MIKLEEEDDDPHDGEDGCTILVGLMQKDLRKDKRFGRDPDDIGFYIYKVTGYEQSVILLVLETTLLSMPQTTSQPAVQPCNHIFSSLSSRNVFSFSPISARIKKNKVNKDS